jgi:fibro-slime domain-containing protein
MYLLNRRGMSAALLLLSAAVWSTASFKDTIHVPVTIWDFHSDRSNPEFERNYRIGLHTGMVDSVLDANHHPVLGPLPYFNNEIARWFVPWTPGDFTIPTYTQTGGVAGYVSTGPTTVDYDTAFKNIRIDTFLVFTLVQGSAGSYEYINNEFFPIDDRGFGIESNSHNYGFTMELHWTFVKVPGLSFEFTGDDDVWAYMNGKLVMDIGGIHLPESGLVLVDSIPGLVNGQRYAFDFFSAERHVTGSVIRITTNIIGDPKRITIQAIPSDTIRAGDTATLIGTLFDVDGVRMPLQSDSINWTQNPVNVLPGDQVIVPMNDTTMFTATVAYRRVGIIARFSNATITIQDTVWITVIPNVPAYIDIVRQSRTPLSRAQALDSVALTTNTPMLTASLDSIHGTMYLYAAWRDRYGNLAGLATNAAWSSLNTDTVTVLPTTGMRYEALVTRATNASIGRTFIVASDPSLARSDSALVTVTLSPPVTVVKTIPNPAIASKVTINGVVSDVVVEIVGPKEQSAVLRTVLREGKGSVIAIQGLRVPSTNDGPVKLTMKIYDVNGNSVIWINNPDIFKGRAPSSSSSAYLFWDGFNQKGMKVAPGVYRAVVYIDFPVPSNIRDIRTIVMLGIRH